jgi:Xaa-Pro aminopeptidase
MDAQGPRDEARFESVRRALDANRWDALICTLPSNVLLLSGYWPVIGSAIAIATRDAVAVLAPEDEEQLAARGWADVVRTFQPGPLDAVTSVLESVRRPLTALLMSLGLERASVAFESGGAFDPASYASRFLYGASLPLLFQWALPHAALADGTSCFASLRAVLTEREQSSVRKACAIARAAFEHAAAQLHAGMSESDVAALLRSGLLDQAGDDSRSDGFAWCMSGPNAAQAYAAFQQTTPRPIEAGDCVLVHCNSYVDGFWTDITRTFWVQPSDEDRRTIEAVLTAAERARTAVRAGAAAADVDRAAREVMTRRGLGGAFKHATGHGVGFAAIDHNALPRIHPCSHDRLEAGMVFNIEPAAYFPGRAGTRHCDMVLVTDTGAELLTGFQNAAEQLVAG